MYHFSANVMLYIDTVGVRRQRRPDTSGYKPQASFKMLSVLSQLNRRSLVMS